MPNLYPTGDESAQSIDTSVSSTALATTKKHPTSSEKVFSVTKVRAQKFQAKTGMLPSLPTLPTLQTLVFGKQETFGNGVT